VQISFAKVRVRELCLGDVGLGHDYSGQVQSLGIHSGKLALPQVEKLVSGRVGLAHLAAHQLAAIGVRKVDGREFELLC